MFVKLFALCISAFDHIFEMLDLELTAKIYTICYPFSPNLMFAYKSFIFNRHKKPIHYIYRVTEYYSVNFDK